MNSTDGSNPIPPRKRRAIRRWLVILGAILVLPAAFFAALPWLLSTPAGSRLILARLNRGFAPGRLDVASIAVSWVEPTRLGAIRLDDPTGKTVVAAPSGRLSANLWDFLIRPHRLGRLTLDSAAFDVVRKADGSLDLSDALAGIVANPDPRRDLKIRADRASITVLDRQGAIPPLKASMTLNLDLPPSPQPLGWDLRLESEPGRTLQSQGVFDRWHAAGTPADYTASFAAARWPVVVERRGVSINADLIARGRVASKAGQLKIDGLTRFPTLRVAGPALKGDTLNLDELSVRGSVARRDGRWSVEQVEADGPFVEIRGTWPGPNDPDVTPSLKGWLDLAAIAGQVPHALGLREGLTVESGLATVSLAVHPEVDWSIDAMISDLSGRQGDRLVRLADPASLSVHLTRKLDTFALDRLDIRAAGVDVSATGDLDRGIAMTTAIDLGTLRDQLADWVDLGKVEMNGRAVGTASFRREGAGYRGETKLETTGLRVVGVVNTPIEAERGTVVATVEGRSDPDGWPRSIESGRVVVESGAMSLAADLRPGEIHSALKVTARLPVQVADHRGDAEGRLVGRWDHRARSLAIDELELGLKREGDAPRLSWTSRGSLDVANGTLALVPIGPIDDRAAITLGPEGLKVVGLGGPADSIRAEVSWLGNVGAADASLARWSGRPARGLDGRWSATATAKPGADGLMIAARMDVNDLSWPGPDDARGRAGGPIAFAARSVYRDRTHRLDVAELSFVTPYARLEGAGSVDRLDGQAVVDFRGTIAPEWSTISTMLADRVEPRAKISGEPHAFAIAGPIAPDLSEGPPEPLDVRFGLQLTEADLFGMKLGPTPIDVRVRGGDVSMAPIDTTMNEGRLRLAPVFDLDDPDGPVIRLGPESSLKDAVVNEEVSRRVLSFVAPVLDRTTRATGRVSVAIEDAEFPVVRDVGRRANVVGSVVFQDLEFAPGPLARQMFAMVSRREPPSLRLDKPVLLSIADGRVNQSGLALPLGDITQVEVSGWVDFDRNLGLVASLPMTPEMFPNSPKLAAIVSGTRINVPIGGTLADPKLDKTAFNAGMKDFGTSLLAKTAGLGALDLLNALSRPRDPNAPPPPTAAERRAMRLEKKNQRRMNRGMPPLPIPE